MWQIFTNSITKLLPHGPPVFKPGSPCVVIDNSTNPALPKAEAFIRRYSSNDNESETFVSVLHHSRTQFTIACKCNISGVCPVGVGADDADGNGSSTLAKACVRQWEWGPRDVGLDETWTNIIANEIFDDVIRSVNVDGGPDVWLRSSLSSADNYELVRWRDILMWFRM